MKAEIKVLMVVPNLRVSNGVASFAMSYYRNINHLRTHVDFVCYRNIESPYTEEIERNGDHVFYLPPLKRILKHIRYCKKIIENGRYDIIHDNSLMITYPLMRIAKKNIGLRILHSHNTKLGETKRKEMRNRVFISLLLNCANHYSACSSTAGKALFGNQSFEIIPNIIDTSNFCFNGKTRTTKRIEEKCEEKKIIGTVGRLAYQKNPFFAIDIIEKIVINNDNIIYWWIGSGSLDDAIKQYVNEKGLSDRIILFGSRNDVDELYQAMDVFFLPSKFEGFGLSCLEAQTSGLSCVVSNAFPSEINVTGQVQELPLSASLDTWIDAIYQALQTKVDRCSSFHKVDLSIYSSTTSGKRLTEYYSKLISHQGD